MCAEPVNPDILECFTCIAFRPSAANVYAINLLMLTLNLNGYEAFWFTMPSFRAPLTRHNAEAWLLYTNAPTDLIMTALLLL